MDTISLTLFVVVDQDGEFGVSTDSVDDAATNFSPNGATQSYEFTVDVPTPTAKAVNVQIQHAPTGGEPTVKVSFA